MRVSLVALPGIPLIAPGDSLADILHRCLEETGAGLESGDILVVAQKIVSKAEGRYVDLEGVQVSERARSLAAEVDKDPRLVELILSESTRVVRHRPGVLIVAHRLGPVMANAGIDQSNVGEGGRGERVLLLPADPDDSARRLRRDLRRLTAVDVGVIINDSVGRPWRRGTVGLALGVAGVAAVVDHRQEEDLFGRPLRVTEVGLADEIASAASMVMGQGGEGTPAVLVRGVVQGRGRAEGWRASTLLRDESEDLFR